MKLAFDKKDRKKKRFAPRTFVAFRSHYLFASHFCTPAAAWEKGQVEHAVKVSRENYLVPIPEAASFEEVNRLIVERCLQDDKRRGSRPTLTIGQAWEQERPLLQPLPRFAYDCCEMVTVRLTPSSQATYETNRYSVPVKRARREVTIKAYPFHIDIYDKAERIASHPRCYGGEQDMFDPLHSMALLAQRPAALDSATPMKRWRQEWPPCYHQMLAILKEKWPQGRGVQAFIRILQLHQDYPADLLEQAIEQALALKCVHLDGVLHCLRQLTEVKEPRASLDLSDRPDLQNIGNQPVDLSRYEKLLKYSWERRKQAWKKKT